jgi:hypothetical protein
MLDRLATTVHDFRAPTTNAPSRCTWAAWAPQRTPGPCARTCQPGRAMGLTACTVVQNGLPAHHAHPRWFRRAAVAHACPMPPARHGQRTVTLLPIPRQPLSRAPGPAIRHPGEQFQQVTTDAGTRRRHHRDNRLDISNGNGRLDHGEAPGRTRICGKNHVLPELRPIFAATHHTGTSLQARLAANLMILKQPCANSSSRSSRLGCCPRSCCWSA